MAKAVRVATWNTEWRAAASADAAVIRDRLRELAPEIVCLTETHINFLDDWGGHIICGSDDWGGPTHRTRREVLLWSRSPWLKIDRVGSDALPPGRYVRGVTTTSCGETTVVGIVIPYHMSNVRHGSCDRKMWELHRAYLEALPAVTSCLPADSIILGDFNQRIPNNWVPHELRGKLAIAMEKMKIATVGNLQPLGKASIDHIAAGAGFEANSPLAISNEYLGRAISDHFGVAVTLEANVCSGGGKRARL